MADRIGVWGHYHGNNIGDDIVVATIIENLRRRRPDVDLYGFSLDPSDTSQRHDIPSYSLTWGQRSPHRPGSDDKDRSAALTGDAPVRGAAKPNQAAKSDQGEEEQPGAVAAEPSLRTRIRERLGESDIPGFQSIGRRIAQGLSTYRMWRAVRPLDAVVVAGSGPVFDAWGGPWSHPYNLLKWALVARLAGTKFILLSVGAGPIEEPLSASFLRRALRLASYHSFRDPTSVDVVHSLDVTSQTPFFPDLAFSLDAAEIDRAQKAAITSGRPIVGISTMAYMDPRHWPEPDPEAYRAYIETMSRFAAWLMQEGYDVLLLKSHRAADVHVAKDMIDWLSRHGENSDTNRVLNPPVDDYRDLLTHIAGCALTVGVRFHCHVLPFVLGKPVVGVAYHPKSVDLMKYMGQEDYGLDIDTVTVGQLIDRFQKLRARQDEEEKKINERVALCRDALSDQYDFLFGEASWPADLDASSVGMNAFMGRVGAKGFSPS
jgi:polysaccharide pyruvyl transferase WcaK-like protein